MKRLILFRASAATPPVVVALTARTVALETQIGHI
jgi:hypothetical protein